MVVFPNSSFRALAYIQRAAFTQKYRFTMPATHTPKLNHLLASLPSADYERLLPDLEQVPLELRLALYESGRAQEYVYFPTGSIVSLLYVMHDGSSAEI